MSKQIGTLPDLIEWLEGRSPDETYRPFCSHNCLLAQYLRDRVGSQFHACTFNTWYDQGNVSHKVNIPLMPWIATGYKEDEDIPFPNALDVKSTFGSALSRAHELQREMAI